MLKNITVIILCFAFSCVHAQTSMRNGPDYTRYVNPMVGTGGHGHTFPGAVVPFGMVQLSPDTRLSGWDGCGGYHYSDKKIYGFSHTHLSGTGCSDLGDVLITPFVGKPKFNQQRYAHSFNHNSEIASPGYYAVALDNNQVLCELTVTPRSGLHRYIFNSSYTEGFVLNLNHRDKLKHGEINIVGDTMITGYRLSSIWADSQYVFFAIVFSKPFDVSGIRKTGILYQKAGKETGRHLKAFVSFKEQPKGSDTILVKVGISTTSIAGALKNLNAEQSGFDFEKVKREAIERWNAELGKVEIESKDTNVMRLFYTSFYHMCIHPMLNQDVDSSYRGCDLQVHRADFEFYTGASLWDTYRALHPFFTIIDRRRTADFVNSFVVQYEQTGLLPVWSLSSCETWGMIGYHSVSVINDAYQKGITGFDAEKAFEGMKRSSTLSRKELNKHFELGPIVTMASFYRYAIGWNDYQRLGYMRCRKAIESVSKTLEFSYDDWCIAQMARKLGKQDDYNFFIHRAQNYKNILDSVSGFMRPRQKHFIKPFNPYAVTIHFTEADAWQYSFYVPQDLSGQMNVMGGRKKLAEKLDSLFTTTSKLQGLPQHDITGMIGQYAHGNEPSHQIAYEYDYVAEPWKTQVLVRRIMNEMYHNQPDGLAGNEDCGQMSAWYVFSALGFYPVCPGSQQYAIGSPLVDKAVIHLENGKTFTIVAENNSQHNSYIQSAKLNGNNYPHSYLTYSDIMNGGMLNFRMGAGINKNWGSADSDIPVSKIE